MLLAPPLARLSAAVLVVFSLPAMAEYGRTQGAFGASGGAANYTIPIWTPPGPNGLQPLIALSYSSQSGNGLGGVGWNLSAVSSIERCNRTIGQDGFNGGVEMSGADRYCINGNRMRVVSGTYGAAGSVYHTELADFSRITAYGSLGNGPQSFVVEAKSGLKYEYGNTTDSRVFVGVPPGFVSTTPARWMLNRVLDRSGNKYVISYNNSNGFAVPDVISWTPTSHGATTYRYEAKFNYINNRTDLDSYLGKVWGYDVANRYRLENIQIKSAGVVKRKYRFTYDTSSVTSRSRLISAKECADDSESNCFLPITFSYQTGVAGVTSGGGTPPAGSSNNLIVGRYDFNGDGKDDIAYWNGSSWSVALGANSGFSGPYTTGVTGSVLIDDFLPTGRSAFLTSVSGVLWTYRWDDASSSFVGSSTGASGGLPSAAMDFNGDRMTDLVYYANGTALNVRMNTSTGSGNPSFGTLVPTAQLTGNLQYAGFQPLQTATYRNSDVNGDGRNDVRVQIVTTGMGGGVVRTTYLYGSSVGFDIPAQAQWTNGTPPVETTVNLNGDRCADKLISTFGIALSNCTTSWATGVPLPAAPKLFLDWDGDGKMDLAVDNGGTLGIYRSTGAGFSSLIATSVPSSGSLFAMDQDGDGLDDLIRINGSSAVSYWTHTSSGVVPTFATNVPDLLSGVTDGFGVNHTPNYVSTAAGSYDKGATTPAPLQESRPMIVVAQVTESNGIGGSFNRSFYYVGARDDANRSAFAGFQRIDEVDSRNGVISRISFEQSFPKAGMVNQQELLQPNGVTAMSRSIITNDYSTLDATANNQRYFPFVSVSDNYTYEVGGTWNGSTKRFVRTINSFDSGTGTLYDQVVTTQEPSSGANGVTGGGLWVERIFTPPGEIDSDFGANWCIGRLKKIERRNSHNLTYGSELVRTTHFAWNSEYCRPTQVVEEHGNSNLQVTTDLRYDTFGNVDQTTVTGYGMSPRITSTLYSNATYQTGQFPLSVTNALNQQSTSVWNYDLGVPTSATDPNGVSIYWQYDSFGRRSREDRADGTYSTWTPSACGACDSRVRTLITQNSYGSSSGLQFTHLYFLDELDRSIYEYVPRADNFSNVTTRNFDALGRVAQEYFPYINNASPLGYTSFTYDLLNRTTSISRPISDSNSALQTDNIYYLGLTTRAVDAQGKERIQVVNARGETARWMDHDGYYVAFDYDPFGMPKRVLDNAGNTLQSSNYNLRGMLTSRTDMDMGSWGFTPNPLGEVVSQTDAKGQTKSFGFDLLGRLTSLSESEGTSTWTWGTSSAAKNIGKLSSVSGPGYSESYSFDSIGRPSTTTINADTSYQFDYGYNDIGLLDSLTYPTSTAGYRLKLKYEYQRGTLVRISDFNVPANGFWVGNAFNSRGQITQELLGNGLVSNRSYDAVTGSLKSIQTGLGGGSGVQNLTYEWDLVGNLKKRRDLNQSNLTEEFFYDNLYRVDYSTRNGSTNLDVAYDAMGNITSKSDVGSYTYHSTKKHQLTSAGSWSFGYDNNGNMTDGRFGTASWTSFNYPLCVAATGSCLGTSSNWSKYSYTPNRQYWKQEANYTSGGTATTIYVGGLMEIVSTSAGTDYKHFIRAGGATIIVSRQSGGTNATYYVTQDHLGSSSEISNSSGSPVVNLSFDAFGKRRGVNWTGSPSSGDWAAIAATTRRGYTGHTMVDNLDLIHMNGRIQDPLLGRFGSADPFITEPSLTQNWNRFSYVLNNPLTFSDPTGFDWECRTHLYGQWERPMWIGLGAGDGPVKWKWQEGYVVKDFDVQCTYRYPGTEIETREEPQGENANPPCPQVNDPNFPKPTYKDFGYSPNFFLGHGDFSFAITNWYDGADARRLAGITDRLQNQHYPPSNGHDEANAFRHAHVSLMLTQQLGAQTARTIMDAHERSGAGSEGDHLMDLYNNDIAIRAADKLGHLLPNEAVPAVQRLIAQGCLRTTPF